MDESPLRAAVAAGTLGSEGQHRALLQSVDDVARAIFDAKASSIFLFDEETEELVFEAVSGEGEEEGDYRYRDGAANPVRRDRNANPVFGASADVDGIVADAEPGNERPIPRA